MSFLAVANPPAHNAEQAIANDGFWPDVDCEQLRKDIRLDGTVTAERLRLAVEHAMWSVNAELREWKAAQIAAGHEALEQVPAPAMAGKSVKVRQYMRAIYSSAQAQLAEAYRDMDTLPQGAGKDARVMTALDVRVDAFNQQLRWAIADLKDAPRTTAELL